jgi:protein-S-isoprenylcysteine O-methyltransferase Ste14
MNLEHLAPLGLLIVFFAVAAGWRAWHQRRRYGASGVVLSARTRRERLGLLALVLVPAVLGAQAVLYALAPESLTAVALPIGHLASARVPGAAIVLIALGLLVWAQLDLGASWRIGIERAARPGLVTAGFYRFVRNPIFGFLLLGLAGFCALLPTWPSVVALPLAWAAVRAQVAEEEAWLLASYGTEYTAYARRVGRFVPGIGRIRHSA